MGDPDKKRLKAEAKRDKKQAKAELKARKKGAESSRPPEPGPPPAEPGASTPHEPPAAAARGAPAAEGGPSAAVRYAELVRGVLYAVLGASLIVALILGQQGAIVSLDQIIEQLFSTEAGVAAAVGKIALGLIGLALLIYGLKYLRLVR